MRRGRHGFWLRLAVVVLRPTLTYLTSRDWRGAENIPRTGGVILVTNHVSHADPLTFAHFVYDAGRLPRFLTKESLFHAPVVGRVVRGAGQIPVRRETVDAVEAFSAAVAAVRRGEALCIYPEATLTRDPGLWPMSGKTGAARVALTTGAPVVPVAQWGAQDLLAPYARWPHVLPRTHVSLVAGPPVDLLRFAGQADDPAAVRAATEAIMDAITDLLVQLRGGPAPAVRFDPGTADLPRTGRPDPPRGDGRRT